MKFWPGVWPALLVVQTVGAQQRTAPYVDPVLRMLSQPAARQAIERAPRLGTDVGAQAQPFGGRVALIRESAVAEPRVGVFVQLRDQTGVSELRALGAVIGSVQN